MMSEAVVGEVERGDAGEVVQDVGGDEDVRCDGMRRERRLVRALNPLIFELEEGQENDDCGGGVFTELLSDQMQAPRVLRHCELCVCVIQRLASFFQFVIMVFGSWYL